MIDFATKQACLLAWWTGFGMQAGMRDDRAEFIRPGVVQEVPGTVTGAIVYIKFTSVRAVGGGDEWRHTVSAQDATKVDTEVTGNRVITISCLVESYIDLPDRHALFLCERARTRLGLPSVNAAFEAAGMGINNVGPSIDLPYKVDNHTYSRASFDLTVNANASETDEPMETIETFLLTSNWKSPGGVSLPAGYQLDDEVIGP